MALKQESLLKYQRAFLIFCIHKAYCFVGAVLMPNRA